jgi:hypothetical protein
MANLPRSVKDKMVEEMWPDLAAYEKGPQKKIDDKVNPFRGATPAKAADAAALAAVAAGQVDATPGGAPAVPQTEANTDPLTDDSPVVDEDGTLGDPTESGEGTSDETSDSSTETADPSGESDPNADLTSDETSEEEESNVQAPKKGSAAERIVEVLDLMEGYKIYGKAKEAEVAELRAELERLRPAPVRTPAPAVVEEKDEPMPDVSDEDVGYDNDKYRTKMAAWVKKQGRIEARREMQAEAIAQARKSATATIETKVAAFEKTHPDFDVKVRKNRALLAPEAQLHPVAGGLMVKSEYTADLLYAFGSDTAMALRVAKMDPDDQVLAVNDMIAKIKAEKKATVKPTTPQTGAKPVVKKSITQAPPPPRPTTGGGSAVKRDIQDPSLVMDEFARAHRAEKQNAREANRKQRGLN